MATNAGPSRARLHLRLRVSALGVGVVTLLAAGGVPVAHEAAAGAASAAPATRHAPEQFTGSVDDFYRVPDPLPRARPGVLIRTQDLGVRAGAQSLRVMYHSRDVRGRDRAVTGTITYPVGPAPHPGWPVVSWAHGTTGLASQCAPSRVASAAPSFGIAGVDVATDYVGLGPVGERHPYLSGASEAHSVIDGVRAARLIAAAHAGRRWLAIGHSQGGHSALFTNQLAGSYAPELKLLGTVSVAPAAVLRKTFGPADQVVPRIVGLMALYGWAADYRRIKPDDYVGPQIAAAAGVIDTGCLDQVTNAFVVVPAASVYLHDPLVTKPAATVVRQNDPGRVRSRSPLLLVSGSADTYVVPARVQYLFHQLCRLHQVTQLTELPGANHGTELAQGSDEISAWINARFAGDPAPNSCPRR